MANSLQLIYSPVTDFFLFLRVRKDAQAPKLTHGTLALIGTDFLMEPWASHSLLEPCPAESLGTDLCLDRPRGIVLRCSVVAILIPEPPWASRDLDVAPCIS